MIFCPDQHLLNEPLRKIMSKDNCQAYICRPYCMFFKGEEKEDLSCRGAQIVERLVDSKRVDMRTVPPLQKDARLWEAYRTFLGSYLCRPCPFFAADCDFQATQPPDDSEPCGGFILLAHLYDHKMIQTCDLEK
jgi:hypothetical protein